MENELGHKLLGRRSSTDRYVAGVAGGIAHRFNVDPFFLRIGLVGATFLIGNGDAPALVPAIYLVLWLVMSTETRTSALRRVFSRQGFQEVAGAVLLFGFALVVILNDALWVALALAVGAWMLLTNRPVELSPPEPPAEGPPVPPPPPPSPTMPLDQPPPPTPVVADDDTAEVIPQGVTEVQSVGGSQSDESPSLRWARTWRRDVGPVLDPESVVSSGPQRPSLWPVTLGLLVVLVIVTLTVENVSAGGIKPGIVADLALLIIGGVVLLSAWRGQARGTALLAIPLIIPWLAFSASGIDRFEGDGEAFHTPTQTPDSGRLEYETGYGSIDLDLTQLDLEPGSELVVDTAVTAGSTRIQVPANADVRANHEAGIGFLEMRSTGVSSEVYEQFGRMSGAQDIYGYPHGDERIYYESGTPNIYVERLTVVGRARERFDAQGPVCILEIATDPSGDANEGGGFGLDGEPCEESVPPDNPAVIVINNRAGLGNLEVSSVVTE